jgi:hypothetical protein
MAELPSSWPGWSAMWATGPSGQMPWVNLARVEKVLRSILFPEKWLQEFKTCKNHRKFPVIQKIANDLSKCSEK